jgi:hypothetical protein
MWSYDKVRRVGHDGRRWHFVIRMMFTGDPDDEPREYYFRDDERSEFGMIRFDRVKGFPYRDYESLASKIMNNSEFRSKHLDAETKSVWSKNWK